MGLRSSQEVRKKNILGDRRNRRDLVRKRIEIMEKVTLILWVFFKDFFMRFDV